MRYPPTVFTALNIIFQDKRDYGLFPNQAQNKCVLCFNNMAKMAEILTLDTPGRAMMEITCDIEQILTRSCANAGVAHLFIQHTSASLTIQENADPDVQRDLLSWLDRIAPEEGPYIHSAEGSDDMPAHIKTAITSTSLTIPFEDGRLLTGTWQGVYVIEHRRRPHRRRIVVTLLPTVATK